LSQPDKNVYFKLDIDGTGQTKLMRPEQVMAFSLQKISNSFIKDGKTSNDMVISVPPYMGHTERRAYLDAAKIAGINCLRLMNDSSATALQYGHRNKSEFIDQAPRTVCFIDFGHSYVSLTLVNFFAKKATILYQNNMRNLGGRDIDYLIYQLLSEEFTKKYGDDPRESPKCKLRLLEMIEKKRKTLSSNKTTDFLMECLLNDNDLSREMSRDEFEKILSPLMELFFEFLFHSVG